MSQESMFTDLPASEAVQHVPQALPPREIRIKEPVRNQVEIVCRDLDSFLPEDHAVRLIWAFLDRMDLGFFYRQVQAYLDGPGRPATSPKVLLTLWLYATTEQIGSARRLAGLCERDDVYRWICGGVPINYHMLSDFRVLHKAALDTLMTDILAAMMSEGLVTLKRVAQDGMRVRASAGASSFRRGETLENLRVEAAAEVERLSRQIDAAEETKRERAARKRAARERHERLVSAQAALDTIRGTKQTQAERAAVRVSTTDPEARVMKMADGGFRPAFNVQAATDTESQVIVGVSVTATGSDASEAPPMVLQVEARAEKKPDEYLVDGGFANKATVEQMADSGITLYAPVQKPKDTNRDPHQPLPNDSEAVAAWRIRMGEAKAKEIYKERAATAECVNAKCRSMYGMRQFNVRGIHKVTCVVFLTAIAHNLLRWIALVG